MLAPPASRAGVPRAGGARARLSEKQAAHGGGGSGSVSVAALGVDMTSAPLVQVQSKASPSSAAAGVQSTSSKPVPLHLRMVSDVEFIVFPFSLMFCDAALEMDYLKCAAPRVPRHVRRTALALMLLFAVSLGFDSAAYRSSNAVSAHQSAYLVRLVLTAVCLLLTLLFALLARVSIPYHPVPQIAMASLLTVMGSLWAVATVYEGGDLLTDVRTTDSAGFLVWLVLVHGCGRFLFFHMSCIPSGVSTVVYIVTASVWSSSREHDTRIAWHCLLSVGCLLACWFVQYRLEMLKRFAHLSSLKVELGRREKADLRKEAFDLRDEMYVMTLERYDIADVDKSKPVEFKSPMEQAMAKLQALSDNKALPKDAFLELQKVIGLLGNSSDVFKVQVSEALADKNIRLDDETTRYLFDLVNDNNYEEAPGTVAATGQQQQQQQAQQQLRGFLPNGVPPSSGMGHRKSAISLGGLPDDGISDDSAVGGGSVGGDRFPLDRSNTRVGLGSIGGPPSLLVGVLPKEEKQLNDLLKGMDTWNFDVFDVANLTSGKPLFFVGTALFKKYNLIQTFRIDRQKLSSFLNVIENGYLKTNPYHNGIHASDVARTVHYFLHTSMRPYTSDLEILALIIASIIHDFDHPGKTNQFHIAVRDPKAILYNDRSVLENHHCAQAFFLLNKDEHNILSELSAKDYAQVRKLVVELVLATDLGAHFDFLAQFKSSISSGTLDASADKLVQATPAAGANRLMIYKMALKCGDLGHSCKTLALHEKWTHRITEEFYRQGDEERKRSLPISPFMDRQKANLPQSQVGFLDFLVVPLFSVWVKFLEIDEAQCPLWKQLMENKSHWKAQLEQPKPATIAATVATPTAPADGKESEAAALPSPPSARAPDAITERSQHDTARVAPAPLPTASANA